jgi:fructose-1,6-bisphosphatase/sedoheptulose 1,7-bisphosphatase-like protein
MVSGCGASQSSTASSLNKVEGTLIEVEYNSSTDTKIYKIQDSYGKTETVKSSSSNVQTIMHVGDKVEIYYDNDFYPKKITVKPNNMR